MQFPIAGVLSIHVGNPGAPEILNADQDSRFCDGGLIGLRRSIAG